MPSPIKWNRTVCVLPLWGNCFPFSHLATEWWKSLLLLSNQIVLPPEASLPPMPAESIAPVVLQMLILKQLPFCIRNFQVAIHLPQYTIYNKDKHMSFTPCSPNHLSTWDSIWSLLNLIIDELLPEENIQIILHILDHVPCFLMFV